MFLSLPSTTRSEIPPWMLCVSERARFRDGNAGDRKCFCVVHQQASLSFQRGLIQAKFNPVVNEALTFLPELSSKHGGVGCTGRGFLGVMAAVQGDGYALCHPSLAAQLTSLCFRPKVPRALVLRSCCFRHCAETLLPSLCPPHPLALYSGFYSPGSPWDTSICPTCSARCPQQWGGCSGKSTGP